MAAFFIVFMFGLFFLFLAGIQSCARFHHTAPKEDTDRSAVPPPTLGSRQDCRLVPGLPETS
jgi:hypothetical protein